MNGQTYVLKLASFEADQFTEEVYTIWENLIKELQKITRLKPQAKKTPSDAQHYLKEEYVFRKRLPKGKAIHFVIQLSAARSVQKYEVYYNNYDKYTNTPKVAQVEGAVNQHLHAYAHSTEEILQLISQDLNDNTVWLLDNLIGNTKGEISLGMIRLFETALQSNEESLQEMAALIIEINEDCWKAFKPLSRWFKQRIAEQKDSADVVESFERAIASLQREEEREYSWMDMDILFNKIAENLIETQALKESEKEAFLDAERLLGVPNQIYVWYSERSVDVWHKNIPKYLAAYERWQEQIEPYYQYGSVYKPEAHGDSCYHPLGAYVLASQFLWHEYQLETAEPHLIRSAYLASTLETPKDMKGESEKMIPVQKLANIKFDKHYAERYYQNASLYALNYFYLGELYEKQQQYFKAIEAYQMFLTYEPNFVAKKLALREGYYDLSRQLPDSKKAKERIEYLSKQDPKK